MFSHLKIAFLTANTAQLLTFKGRTISKLPGEVSKTIKKLLAQKKGGEKIVCNKILKEKNCFDKISHREFQHNNQEF